jgi:hypothetical protein
VIGVKAGAEDLQRPLQNVVVRLPAEVVLDVALGLTEDGGHSIQRLQTSTLLTSGG